MTANQLIAGVIFLTLGAVFAIVVLTVWHTGDNTGAITAILTIVMPAVSVLILLLQGQRTEQKVKEVKQDTQSVMASAHIALQNVKKDG